MQRLTFTEKLALLLLLLVAARFLYIVVSGAFAAGKLLAAALKSLAGG